MRRANAARTSSLALHYLLADDLRHTPIPRTLPTLDDNTETARAYAGLATRRYLLVVDGVAVSDLDAPLTLTDRSVVSFVRLLPLMGEYRIHLATAAIYLDSGQYLCIVTDPKERKAIYLPFEDSGEPVSSPSRPAPWGPHGPWDAPVPPNATAGR